MTKHQEGFTLIEMIMVIVILAIVSIVAIPKFIDFRREARIAVLKQVEASIKTANNFMKMKSYLPSYSKQDHPTQLRISDVDLDGNGIFETRLIWGYLDNTDIIKRIDISSDLTYEERGAPNTYFGYDLNGDVKVFDDNCYFHYTQAQNNTTPPDYEIVDNGC